MRPALPRYFPAHPLSCWFACLCVCVCGHSLAYGQSSHPVTLLHPDLEATRVNLRAIEAGVMSYDDQQKRLRAQPMDAVVRVVFMHDTAADVTTDAATRAVPTPGPADDAEQEPPMPRGLVSLTDGQVIAGVLQGSADQGQSLLWTRAGLGSFSLPLTRVRSVVFAGHDTPAVQHEGPHDLVLLANGDRLVGFLNELQPSAIVMQLSGNDQAITLPLARVAAMYLANPPMQPEPTDYRVHLTDGSALNVATLSLQRGMLTLLTEGRSESEPNVLPLDQVAAIDSQSRGYRLTELARLPWQVTSGGAVFGAPAQPLQQGGDMTLHAPVAVSVSLPAGAQRLAGLARLNIPQGTLLPIELAHFDVVFSSGDQELLKLTLSEKNASTPFNTPLTGSTLRIELDPSINGPVLDRLRLVRPMVLSQISP